jgi:hypothetical protein
MRIGTTDYLWCPVCGAVSHISGGPLALLPHVGPRLGQKAFLEPSKDQHEASGGEYVKKPVN